MKSWVIAGALIGLAAAPAFAEDHEAGVPLTPAEAAGAWTLSSSGHDLCVLTLGTAKAGSGYAVKSGSSCGDVLPVAPAAWRPTADGMALVGADGQTALAFNRWSNSLFVSHRGTGVDVQLRRGTAPSGQ